MNNAKIDVYYDSWCPICTKYKKRLERMDVLNKLNFVTFREPSIIAELNIPLEKLEKEMHIRKPNGQILRGYDAICSLFSRIPFLVWLWPFMKVLKFLGVGNIIYNFIASRRLIIPTGNCGKNTCEINKF